MKKLLQLAAILIISCSTADATMIHSVHIKAKGPRGFKDVGEFTLGGLLNRKWCLGPGTLNCPYICACGSSEFLHPTSDAGNGATGLMSYQLAFISSSLETADKSSDNTGLITQTFIVDGVQTVMTAKFTKSGESFDFDIVENGSYDANITELNAL